MKPTFLNSDYFRNNNNDDIYQDIDEVKDALKDGEDIGDIMGVHSKLLLSDRHGIYIPQIFIENFEPSDWNIDKRDTDVQAIKDGPENEWYWEAWNTIEGHAEHVDKDGAVWHLEQDGDLFAVCFTEYGPNDYGDDDELDEIVMEKHMPNDPNEIDRKRNPSHRGFSRPLIKEIRGEKSAGTGMMINKAVKGDGRFTGLNSILGLSDATIKKQLIKKLDKRFFSTTKIGAIDSISEVKSIGFSSDRTVALEVKGKLRKLYVEINLSSALVRVFNYSVKSSVPESGQVVAEVYYAIDDLDELINEIHKLCLDSHSGTVFREKPRF